MKPPAARLYGRQRSHPLRPRQQVLLDATLPRLRPDLSGPPFPGLDALWVEVGFGGGEHALAQAQAHPRVGLIACEVFENGICSLLGKLVPEGGEADHPVPHNLRVWPDDARALLSALPDHSIARLFLLFPDPWPKARHAKRRFVHPGALSAVARVMQPGAEWRIASDEPTYQHWVEQVMGGQSLFAPSACSATRPPGWPGTRYEAKALSAGRRPRYWVFTRIG